MENNSETYDCTYVFSAEQQNEVKNILEKYLPPREDKMEQLRRLDRSVAMPGKVISLLLGLGGGILHGMGLQAVLTGTGFLSAAGFAAALIGLAAVCSAYPVYRIITRKRRFKMTPQIVSLCRELLK